MMSFSVIGSADGAAGYYSHQDNYYVLGSLESKWMGKGAEKLGLTGPVENDKLTAVLQGKLPDGSSLSYMKDGKETHRPGYDLTFSAPKSVSVLALIGGDKRLIEAHNRAVAVAAGQIETLASTRLMEDGKSEVVLTGNMVAATFNHDTSRDLDPQVHTHLLIANATEIEGQWRSLSSNTVTKNGFSETILANQIALGKIYQHAFRKDVEGMGYQTHDSGKNGLWEITGVPVEPFSQRSQSIRDAVGEDASRKSRDIAALDTRKAKVASDPALLLSDWQSRLKETGFNLKEFQAQAQTRALVEPVQPALAGETNQQVNESVAGAISLLSDNKTQFTYSEVLAKTVGGLPAEAGVFALARQGIDKAIEDNRLIPLDKEKGLFTSDIHLLDELSIHALSKDMMQENRVLQINSEKPVYPAIQTGAVYQLTSNAPPVAVLSGIGGASVQRDRLAEVVDITQRQGRQVLVLSPDNRSQQYLKEDPRFSQGTGLLTRQDLKSDFTLPIHSTLIVDQAEKLTLKETLTVLEQGRNQNAQVVFMDTEQRKGTGNALSVMKDADVPRYQFSGSDRAEVFVVSESDKRERYQQLASDYVNHRLQGGSVSAQVNGVREQQVLSNVIRDALKEHGQINRAEVTIPVLTPIYLDSKSRRQRETYKSGQVMEVWNAESKQRTRYQVDRVTESTNTLTLVNEEGTRVEKISQLDGNWSLYKPGELAVAEGDNLKALGRELKGDIKARDRMIVVGIGDNSITVNVNGKERVINTTNATKLAYGYVDSLGSVVSDKGTVLAAASHADMSAASLNQLSRSGNKIGIYTALPSDRAERKLAINPNYQVVSVQVKERAGKDELGEAVTQLTDNLYSPVQQSVHLGLQQVQANDVAFSKTNLIGASLDRTEGVTLVDIIKEIDQQVKSGELIALPVVKGSGVDLLVSRATYDIERSIIRSVAEGKGSVSPLMEKVPESNLQGLTEGQQEATRLILQTPDRFVAIQGYAGVGKTTQFKAVLSALETLPEAQRPQVIGLAPTHRAVHEMQDIGVKAQTLASFLNEESQKEMAGAKSDYSNTLFLVDESSMVGNRDMANVYQLIDKTGGRAVVSGDVDQLRPIDPGQPFKLQQQRSAIDMAVMKDIVRQSPELKPAIYSMIERNEREALNIVNTVSPAVIERREGAWVPNESVKEIKTKDENEDVPRGPVVLSNEATEQPLAGPKEPDNILAAIAQDYIGRSDEARENTLIVVHVNSDRHAINSQVHSGLHKAGLIGDKEASLSVLRQVNVRSHELRNVAGYEAHKGKIAMLDNQYYTIAGVDKEQGTVTFIDADKSSRILSSFEASKEQVSIYERASLTVSEGDKVRFSRTDNDRGYVANSMWQVKSIEDNAIVLTDGQKDKVIEPKVMADQHIDLAYAVTAHGAQGASSRFVIVLEGTEGDRIRLVSPEGAYVALSRAKEHVQVYTDNLEAFLSALDKHTDRKSAHDILHQSDDNNAAIGTRLLETAKPLQDTALGQALLKTSNLNGKSMAFFVSPGKKYPQPHVALPLYDSNGRAAGVYLDELRHLQSERGAWLSQEPRILGGHDARFAGLQESQNGEVRIASDMAKAFELAAAHPQSGILVRLQGEGEPHNISRITGDRIIPDDRIQQVSGQGTDNRAEYPFILTEQEQLAKEKNLDEQKAQEQIEKMLNNQKVDDETLKSLAVELGTENRQDEKSIAGFDFSLEDKETQNAIRDVAHDLQKERIEQMEREIVKEKEIGE
ncbi:conjugative transfer relaxase/helicase TraI [Budviciaceae bacterium BWR-B9]|uniref:Conjugative transfer relaxase/helicase TraI n=1 Tax=Limnobaculum allomyrinae TaxID=2791986 RepID=A0ABS1IV23_9GAMM|nr:MULTISPECIES: conjugative transfer relaxase/helicase TraI [Limnobaculum]MBK5145532.1 conjugative transfer relaxase/helicase TraI [Limnobaculum allomyrinae]MBV7693651.1 conjugative transfer relaxase/helicase TraI [Limnobaculum sp. M2-1]